MGIYYREADQPGTPVCVWIRVSTGSQDESTQLKELKRYAASKGYRIVRIIRLHDVSASKGEQEEAMAEVVADVQAERYKVILIDDSSRLDRRDNVHARNLFLALVGMAGGRVESRTEPMFGGEDIGSQVTTLIAGDQNAAYSKKLKEQVDRALRDLVANKSYHGKRPWGWIPEGLKYSKQLKCESPEAIEAMYVMACEGKSSADIGREFELYSETVTSIIRNTVNKGWKHCSHTFSNGDKVTWVHQTTPVVSDEVWRLANAQLDLRKTSTRVGGRKAKHLLSGVIVCGECGGIMYVAIRTKYGRTFSYFRCNGPKRTPMPKGCGNTAQLADAEKAIDAYLSSSSVKLVERTILPGNRLQIRAQRVELDQAKEQAKGMPERVARSVLDALEAEYARLDAIPVIEDEEVLVPAGTVAGMWESGDRRKLLESLPLWFSKDHRIGIEESFPMPDGESVILPSGLILDLS